MDDKKDMQVVKKESEKADENKYKFDFDSSEGVISRVVNVSRVAKVIRGGRRFGFSSTVVVGDQNGKVGIGHGKGREVSTAISKAETAAKKKMIVVPIINNTIPHPIQARVNAGQVMLRPAAPGTGVIAGCTIRAIMDCAGVSNVLTKSLGSSNSINIVKATMKALNELETAEEVAARRGLSVDNVSKRNIVVQKSKQLNTQKNWNEEK